MRGKIYSLIDKAVFDFNMLPGGAKILVGASGGKDSTLLIEYLANRLRSARKYDDFSFEAVYIRTDFAPPFSEDLAALMEGWGVRVRTIFVNTLERVREGHRMNCWWCSTQRRKELLDYALANGFNTLALGHHMDDILETFLMNLLEKGELNTMRPVFDYEKYPLRIIRPLAYAPVESIVAHAQTRGWRQITCTCGYQENSGRKEARRRLESLTDGDSAKKSRLLRALKRNSLI